MDNKDFQIESYGSSRNQINFKGNQSLLSEIEYIELIVNYTFYYKF